MARTLVLTKPAKLGSVAYVVDGAVGAGCRNQRDDVLLVQFFLRALGPKAASGTKDQFYQSPGSPALAIDGFCGQRTIAAIKTFQTQFDKGESNPAGWSALIQDGAVHPLNRGSMFGPRLGHLLTIIRLNTEYSFHFGVDRHGRLHQDPLFPRELLTVLFLDQ